MCPSLTAPARPTALTPEPPLTGPVSTEPVPPSTEPVPPSTEPVPPSTEPEPPSTEPEPPSTEPVEVRTAEVDGQEAPVQLIVGGRLWLVRDACRRPVPAGQGRERWRVRAGDGASGSVTVFELLRHGSGRWSLVREGV